MKSILCNNGLIMKYNDQLPRKTFTVERFDHRDFVHIAQVHPFPNNKVLNSSKLKEFADDNFKFDKNGFCSVKR